MACTPRDYTVTRGRAALRRHGRDANLIVVDAASLPAVACANSKRTLADDSHDYTTGVTEASVLSKRRKGL